jgi:hypothetical protein
MSYDKRVRTTLNLDDDIALFDPAHPNHEDAHEWFACAAKLAGPPVP